LLDIIDQITEDDARNSLKAFLIHPGVFDGIISVMVQELRKKPMRPYLCDVNKGRKALLKQFVAQIRQQLGANQVRTFAQICELIPIMKLKLNKSDLSPEFAELQNAETVTYKLYLQGYHKFCAHHWRPEDTRRVSLNRFKGNNTGLMFWGERGCGKSQILAYVNAWAHENSWFNLSIPNTEQFVDGKTDAFRYKNGLYLQKDLARQLLEDLKHINEQLLNETEVDMSLYGKYDISGVKDGEPEPCPRVWDPLRKCWSDEWKE